jgi:hypothetical protein
MGRSWMISRFIMRIRFRWVRLRRIRFRRAWSHMHIDLLHLQYLEKFMRGIAEFNWGKRILLVLGIIILLRILGWRNNPTYP